MNTSKNILFVALLASSFSSSNSLYGWLADFDAIEEFMEQQFEQSLQAMKETRKKLKQFAVPHHKTMSLDTNDKAITITIHNIESDTIEANLNNENTKLFIVVPNKKITIEAYKNSIGIETRETIEQKSNDQKDSAQFISNSIMRQESYVSSNPLLEKQSIDYNSDTKDLIITIPLQQAIQGKSIPINKLPKKEVSSPDQIKSEEREK